MRLPTLRSLVFFCIACITVTAAQTEAAKSLSGDQVVARVAPSVVLILAGANDQLQAVGAGVIARSDGIILTAHHVVKPAKQVQVRLKNGEVYDRVELVAVDERRDVAALRIHATALPTLPVATSQEAQSGATVYLVSHGAGLPWTASAGVLSAARMADEVSGAGSGYRILQFTASAAPGSSGGVLVDAQARALGIAIGSMSNGQNLNFAVPVDGVVGLANASGGTAYASGSVLRLPTAPVPNESQIARSSAFRSISVHSKTIYIRRERLQSDLQANALFKQLGLRFAEYGEQADVAITVDRPFATYEWTYSLLHQPTGASLGTGMIEAEEEFDAGPKLAANILQMLGTATLPSSAAPANVAPATQALRTFRTIFVESHTIYLKGNQLQDALYLRPELKDWGIRIVDDRNAADIYVNVTRPFLTFDWNYQMIDTRTKAVLAQGKVIAWDGPIAAPQLAAEIVKHIRAARPVPSTADKKD